MASIEIIADMLNGNNREILCRNRDQITEIRLRSGREMRLSLMGGGEAVGDRIDVQRFLRIINRLMDDSLYSRENELKQGYFTTIDGFRVGVCGKIKADGGGIDCLVNIGSACIRVPREIVGCSEKIVDHVQDTKRYSILIVSPPGLGKTTVLRDYIRMLSDGGMNVCLADERRELACCLDGVPQLQVGCRTDVLDGCPKSLALSMLIRACSPDMVAADEIGTKGDADALMEASRCGVAVAATAHGHDLIDVFSREYIAALIHSGVFDWCVLLGPKRGQIGKILPLYPGADGKVLDVQGDTAGNGTVGMHVRGQNAFKCATEEV